MSTGPFFQYALRANQLQYAPSDEYRAVLQEQRDRELEDYLASLLPTPWTDVTFQNSWVNFGGTRQDVQYRKVGDLVEVRGAMKDGTNNTTAFTLPAGFRPPADMDFICRDNSALAIINIETDGEFKTFSAGNTLTSFYVSFSVTP